MVLLKLMHSTLQRATNLYFNWVCPCCFGRRPTTPNATLASFTQTPTHAILRRYTRIKVCHCYLYEGFLRSVMCWSRSCSGGLVPGSGEPLDGDCGDQSTASAGGGTIRFILPLVSARSHLSLTCLTCDEASRHRRRPPSSPRPLSVLKNAIYCK